MTTLLYGNREARNVLIQPVDDHDLEFIESEIREIRRLSATDFCLIAVKAESWNSDLSPWPAPPVFGKEGFGGEAAKTLEEILKICTEDEKAYFIGGYSLAGLFALWAAYQTDRFEGVGAASPSVWFPGFTDYMQENRIRSGAVYLSLGDREEKTRNPVMSAVGECIRKAEEILKTQGVKTVLEWNPGNHFVDADVRTARAFAWILNMKSGTGEKTEE